MAYVALDERGEGQPMLGFGRRDQRNGLLVEPVTDNPSQRPAYLIVHLGPIEGSPGVRPHL